MTTICERTAAAMGTVVSIQVVGGEHEQCVARVQRAMRWFERVEATCSRFAADSELRRLCRHVGVPVPVSPLLFEALRFALAVAHSSEGAFDPTVGVEMESRGFVRAWQSGAAVPSGIAPDASVSWRDVSLDAARRAVTLAKPMLLDLGAVAKGMAVDLAARDLCDLRDFAVYAGGDLYLAGHNSQGAPWSVGLRDPEHADGLLQSVRVSNEAVCTSGNYARRAGVPADHIVGTRAEASAMYPSSVTVMAPSAMVADALATAVFALGERRGIAFLEQQGVQGLMVTQDRRVLTTAGMASHARPAVTALECARAS